ncbi:hypothetical protein ACQP26_28445 [Micromonospora sp. CA-248089]|uniref:hypothetical protein n=1 Tax=Micromonospora sp. CA-248089 TaxID=3239960 RepID=UPI003D8EAB83
MTETRYRPSKMAKIGASALAAAAASLAFAAPAKAAYPTSTFSVDAPTAYRDSANGSITWYNRSVGVQGVVWTTALIDQDNVDHTTAYFEVYDGESKKMNSTTRTSSGQNNNAWVNYNFTIGDPDGLKAVARVRVTVCAVRDDGSQTCSRPTSYGREYA